MSKSSGLTHILTELSSLDDLGLLLKRSARLKYTCISASKKYLALGSNSGGVYIFSRDTLKYQQVVFADANSTSVTCVSLSPTDHHIATTVGSGHVSVFELNIDRRTKPERVRHTFDHSNHTVTTMTWDTTGGKLFVGDNTGKLSIVFVPSKSKTLFALPSEVIAYLDVSIFQLDWWENKLLVSTVTNCYVFDTTKHNFSTIGSKKRDGEFGACIFIEPSSQYPVIYCARPGSRIWEVDFEGKVLNTHQFKQLLAVPPVPVINLMNDSYNLAGVKGEGGHSVSFSKMIRIGSLILTWSSKGLYLFDPINVKVMVWTNSYLGIRDIALCGNDAYLFLEDCSIHRLTLLSVYPLFQLLASRGRWSLMSHLLLSSEQINIRPSIIKRVKLDLYDSLIIGLRESGNTEMIERLYAMMDDVSEGSVSSLNAMDDFMGSTESVFGHMTLPSGMVIVSEGVNMDMVMETGSQDNGHRQEDFEGVADEGKEYSLTDGREQWTATPVNNVVNGELQSDIVDGMPGMVKTVAENGDHVDILSHVDEETNNHKTEEDNEEGLYNKEENSIGVNDSLKGDHNHKGDENEFDSVENKTILEEDELSSAKDAIEEDYSQTGLPVEGGDSTATFDPKSTLHEETISSALENNSENHLEGLVGLNNFLNNEDDGSAENQTSEHLMSHEGVLSKGAEESNTANEASIQSDAESPGIFQPEHIVSIDPSNESHRFSNVEIGHDDVIAKAVKVSKKKKKKLITPDQPDKSLSASMRKKMLRSSSYGDLGQSSLYQHKEKDGDTISITTISSIDEDETETEPGGDFNVSGRKQSFDTFSLSEEYDPSSYTRLSLQSSYEESPKGEVIPPLIDRLAAAKGGERPSSWSNDGQYPSSNSPLTESGEFVALVMSGLSKKGKDFIKSLKEKSKPSISPLLLHASQSRKTSLKESGNASVQSVEQSLEDKGVPEIVSPVDKDRSSIEEEAASVVEDQLASLYRRAVRIQAAVKKCNLAWKPTAFRAVLNQWCRELNATMYRFLMEVRQRKEAEGENFDNLRSDLSTLCQKERMNEIESECAGFKEDNTQSFLGDDAMESNQLLHDENIEDVEKDNLHTKSHVETLHELNESSSSHNHKDSFVSYISEILHVNSPFPLTVDQRDAFLDLCTLSFLCGATGDILNAFQLSEHSSQFSLINSLLPKHLQPHFTSQTNAQGGSLLSLVQAVFSADFDLPSCPCEALYNNSRQKSENSPSSHHQLWCSHSAESGVNDGNNNKDAPKVVKDSSNVIVAEEEMKEKGGANFENATGCLNSSMAEDLERSLFLRLFFFLLDFDLIKQEVNKWRCSKFLTWASLIACCYEKGKSDIVSSMLSDRQTESAIDYLRSGILLHPSSLPGHLYRLFEYVPGKTAEFCGEIPTRITHLEVVAMCLLCDKSPTEPLLRYVKKCVIDVPSHKRSSVLGKLCESSLIRFLLLKGLLPSNVKDNNGNSGSETQGLASKVSSVLPNDWLDQILKRVVSPEEQDLILRLCLSLRQWKPCIYFMSKREDKRALIDLLVALGHTDLISENGYVPQTMEEWKLLLSSFLKVQNMKWKNETNEEKILSGDEYQNSKNEQDKHEILNDDVAKLDKDDSYEANVSSNKTIVEKDEELLQNPEASSPIAKPEEELFVSDWPLSDSPITWESLGNLLLKYLGGVSTIEMLSESLDKLPNMDLVPLSPSLLQSCLTDFTIQADQNHLCHEMLERMSMYMWAKKPEFLPPSVCHVVKSEASGFDGGPRADERDMTHHRVSSLLQSTPSNLLMAEYLGTHWGQEIDVKQTCLTCQLPLRLIVSHDVPGVIIFQCGHIFHKKCCPGSICPVLH